VWIRAYRRDKGEINAVVEENVGEKTDQVIKSCGHQGGEYAYDDGKERKLDQ
jgi:hypothetical protein